MENFMPPTDPTALFPVIVVPGITASSLVDEYPMGKEEIWSAVLNKAFERLSMHPDNLEYEAIEPAQVSARRFRLILLPFRIMLEDRPATVLFPGTCC